MAGHVLQVLREMSELPGVTVSKVKGFGHGRATGDSSGNDEQPT